VNTRVTQIDTAKKLVQAKDEVANKTYEETYDHLILAVGAMPLKPPIPGIDRPGLFSLRNLQDMDSIVNWINAKAETMKLEDMHAVVAELVLWDWKWWNNWCIVG
jgi:NADPH-dependent 2,4-dienoyl-CoA reductase/sulfur reductase-like enzyme